METSTQSFGSGLLTKVKLSGALDAAGADKVYMSMRSAVAGDNDVAVDISEVTFISSQGVRLLITSAKAAAAAKRKFSLIGPNSSVAKVLSMMGVDIIIPIYKNIDAMPVE